MSKPYITGIVNEDGTDCIIPANPLSEKWKEKYNLRNGKPCSPILGRSEDGSPIMNYTCVLCHEEKCYLSDGFIVPEEDKEIYEKYLKERYNYLVTHNPSYKDLLEEKICI